MADSKLSALTAGAAIAAADLLYAVQGGVSVKITAANLKTFAQSNNAGSAFTQGSVIFAGASGVYSQDNVNFFWDDSNDILKLGSGAALRFGNDCAIIRDSASAFALYDPTPGKAALRVYNVPGGNYERGIFDWQNTPNVLTIGTEAGGLGTVRPLRLMSEGALVYYSDGIASNSNVFVGGAGNTTVTGQANTALGYLALSSIAFGFNNVAVGQGAGQSITTGGANFALGRQSLSALVAGGDCVSIGQGALNLYNDTGGCVAIGSRALHVQATGGINVAIGTDAAAALTSGSLNTFIGYAAAINVTSGSNNTLLGGWQGPSSAMSSVIALSDGQGNLKLDYNYSVASNWTFATTGIYTTLNAAAVHALYGVYNATADNWFVGEAGNTTVSGAGNTGMGAFALLSLTTGLQNMAIGTHAGRQITSGQTNSAIGYQAMRNATTGLNNTAIGSGALYALTASGSGNIAIGSDTLSTLDDVDPNGSDNTCIGTGAWKNATTGKRNAIIGQLAGYQVTSGSNNTLIGSWNPGAVSISSVIGFSDGAGNLRLDYNYTTANVWTLATKLNIPTSQTGAIKIGSPSGGDGLLQFAYDAAINDPFQMDNIAVGGGSWYVGDGAGTLIAAPFGNNVFAIARRFNGPTFGVDANNNRMFLCGGANAQSLHVYNTYSAAGPDYERGIFSWTSNTLTIGTEALGTGTQRPVTIQSGGTFNYTSLGANIMDYGITVGAQWAVLKNLNIGTTGGNTVGNIAQLICNSFVNSGSAGPNFLSNGNNLSGYYAFGPATTSGTDGRFWFGQAAGRNAAFDTSTSAGHLAHFEVYNGSLGLGSGGTVDVYATRTASGVVSFGTTVGAADADVVAKTLRSGTTTVASLPAAGNKGRRYFVTDANATTFWSIVAGGGANNVPVTDDGTNWRIG